MPQIKDGQRTTIVYHHIDLCLYSENFKTLTPEDACAHLTLLTRMLQLAFQAIIKKLPKDGGNNPDFLQYLKKLTATLDVIVLKLKAESAKPNSDVQMSCTIDPTDSGFPIVVRDFEFLRGDKEKASAELERLPSDEKLVDDALYLLFRGLFPKDVILQKMIRNYYASLMQLDLRQPLLIHPYTHIKQDGPMNYCTVSFERLD